VVGERPRQRAPNGGSRCRSAISSNLHRSSPIEDRIIRNCVVVQAKYDSDVLFFVHNGVGADEVDWVMFDSWNFAFLRDDNEKHGNKNGRKP
jgi:hypothetical protein